MWLQNHALRGTFNSLLLFELDINILYQLGQEMGLPRLEAHWIKPTLGWALVLKNFSLDLDLNIALNFFSKQGSDISLA